MIEEEKALLQAEGLASSLDAVVWMAEPVTGKLWYISSFVERLLGYSPSEYLKEPGLWSLRVHPEDQPAFSAALEQALIAQPHLEFSYRAIARDGAIKWLWDSVRILYDKNKPIALHGVTVDLSERITTQSSAQLFMDVIGQAGVVESTNEVLQYAVSRICAAQNWPFGQAWVLSSKAEGLISLPQKSRFDNTALQTEGRLLKLGEDLPGKVWQEMQALTIVDLEKAGFQHQSGARQNIFRSAFAFPIKDQTRLFSVLEFFWHDYVPPTATFVEAMEKLGQQLGAMFRDRLVQSALKRQREDTQIILDSVPALVFVKDRHNNILRANRAAADSLGMTVQQMEGRSTRDLYPDDAAKYYSDDLEVIERGRPKLGIVEQVLLRDGQRSWVRTDKLPFRRSDGSIEGVIVFAVDITEQKKQQTELQQEKEVLTWAVEQSTLTLQTAQSKLESLSKQVPGIIYQFAIRADGSRDFPYISEGCRHILGFEPDELVGPAWKALQHIHEDDQERLQQQIAESYQSLEFFRFEGRIRNKSGQLRWIQASSTPESLSDGGVIWNGLLTDITDLKEAQQQIRDLNDDLEQRIGILAAVNRELELLTHKLELAYDQATEASRLKSEFVANISHEVRTPISAVIGLSEQLMETSLSQEQREFIRMLRDSAQSLLTIINDILDFSKMEAGKIEFELTDVSPLSLVEGCADLLASTAREKGLSFMTYVEPGVPALVRGDPVRLRQVLLNLASNAIKFTEGGDVTVKAFLINPNAQESLLRFEVNDTGIGLSEAARKRLFQPFVQADGSTSRKYGGTGLGLSISKRLVELMEGEIGVESTLSKGSTFWFTVPLIKSPVKAESAGHSAPKSQRFRVLVADRSPFGSSIVSNYLRAAGFRTDTASDTKKALWLVRTAAEAGQPYKAILAAVEDPGQDPLVEAVVRMSMPQAPQLVLLTNLEERHTMTNAIEHGFAACLVKPFRRAQLIETVNKVLERPAPKKVSRTSPGQVAVEPPKEVQLSVVTAEPAPEHLFTCTKPILVAEDNPVMQELAVRQIKKLGLQADAVSNGHEALIALERVDYGLILMDCQMPELDGFETTNIIREREKTTGKRIAIVAMTASAMKGDRENCISAGMDDYLSKPVSQAQLLTALKRWLDKPATTTVQSESQPPRTAPAEGAQASKADGAPIDVSRLEELYGAVVSCDLLMSFQKESSELMASLGQKLEDREGLPLSTDAHQLKGLAAVMTADRLAQYCLELEHAAREFNWDLVRQCLSLAREELEAIQNYIKKVIDREGSV